MEWIPEIAAEAIQSSLRSMRRVTHRDSNRCIELKALAKVNLGLDVIGKRENGYHDVRMVMQSIYLYDDVKIERSKTREIQIRTNLYFLPTDSSNIAYKAAAMLIEEFHIEEGVIVTLNKHIPVSAGLAGGSSDAAAVLYGMNRLFRLGLSQEELMKRGVKLGADVPYCIMRGTVLAEGIGEELTPLVPMPKCTVVVAKPSISVSTKTIYEALDSKESITHPDIDALQAAVEAGDLQGIASHMGNALEEVTIPMYPVIESIKTQMKEAGALNAMMSGSGPTVFGLFTSRQQARRAQDHIKKSGLARQVYVTNIHGARRCDHGG